MAAALERALGPALPGEGSEAPLPPLPVLVLGPAGSGRTSLLLRTALAGGADGPRVLFLAPSAIPRLPGGPGGTGTDPRALQCDVTVVCSLCGDIICPIGVTSPWRLPFLVMSSVPFP
ncbi:hypothetical protein HGM15179_020273 [Zosterops borbonicus]|uniref:Uncharacterized protein n=1 Tax=Zosterops borbonicus TaxID=364589 RepID=A0A8K1FXQ6_9PASS|nr:hypothetical protein HGM15179_020273 [Zosterops borbonicus]